MEKPSVALLKPELFFFFPFLFSFLVVFCMQSVYVITDPWPLNYCLRAIILFKISDPIAPWFSLLFIWVSKQCWGWDGRPFSVWTLILLGPRSAGSVCVLLVGSKWFMYQDLKFWLWICQACVTPIWTVSLTPQFTFLMEPTVQIGRTQMWAIFNNF